MREVRNISGSLFTFTVTLFRSVDIWLNIHAARANIRLLKISCEKLQVNLLLGFRFDMY